MDFRLWQSAVLVCLVLVCIASARVAAADEVVAPRLRQAPIIDGELGDACWAEAARIENFTLPERLNEPAEKMDFRVCFDDSLLYCAFTCVEPYPQRLRLRHRADSEDVWQDDSVELFLRAGGERLDYEQFIVNAAGARWSLRYRNGQGVATPRIWKAAAAVGQGRWTVEMAVPFAAFGVNELGPGLMVELKLGREDHTGAATILSTWPPASGYGGGQGYGRLYLGDPNLLVDPGLLRRGEEGLAAWSPTAGDEELYQGVEGGEASFRIDTPGRYSALTQTLLLEPETSYLLSAQVRGTAQIYLRARTYPRPGDSSQPHTAWFEPDSLWVELAVPFATGFDGRTETIIGSTESSGRGTTQVRGLRLVKTGHRPVAGPAISVSSDGVPTVVTEVMVADSRAVRGFVGTPFDGSQRSRSWNGRPWEYPMPGAGAGVGYAYRNNDGLHVRLADSLGFDAVQIRGGIRADLYAAADGFRGPGGAARIYAFAGRALDSRANFESRVMAPEVSFFEVGDGVMADVSFFRVGGRLPKGVRALPGWRIGSAAEANEAIADRFAAEDRRSFMLRAGVDGMDLRLEAGEVVHLLAPPLRADTPLAAVELAFELGGSDRVGLRVACQDPVNPRLELTGVDVEVEGDGLVRLVVDFPDQVVPAGRQLWLTLEADRALELVAPEVRGYGTTRQRALLQALPYRRFLLKSFFVCASEARPWNRIGGRTNLDAWFRDEPMGDQVREVFESIEHCLWLDPDDRIARQYHQWVWRNRRGLPEFEPRLEYPAPGAPQWAVWARAAWLTARQVPAWWLENRLVPTGEFGGVVGDDSDMYQNFVDLAFLEDGGVAAQLRDAGARLAELAESTTLIDGINRRTMDPLHAYEEGLNQEALMAVWHYGDPVYLERCMAAAASVAQLTTVTHLGHRHFRSQQVGAAQRVSGATDTDGHAHPLMWHPAFEVLWYNGNRRAEALLRQWGDGWLEHMRPGQYATSVSVEDEQVTRTTPRPLYGGYGALGSAFAFLASITGDERYLEPFFATYAKGQGGTSPQKLLPEFLHRYGALRFGAVLPQLLPSSPVAAALVSADKEPLIAALKRDVAELQRFETMYTDSEPFTDRVFLYGITNAAIAYTGGYASRNKFNRSHGVSWSGFGTDYAALVLVAAPERFKALVYNFRQDQAEGAVRFWSLLHGRYSLQVGVDIDGDDGVDRIVRTDTIEVVRGTPVALSLPPRAVAVVEAVLLERLDELDHRADLALSPLDIHIGEGRMRGSVHNLGGASAKCELALVDANGKIRIRRRLAPLEAPLDLKPRRQAFEVELPLDWGPDWSVQVDPDGIVEELYEGNNAVVLQQIIAASLMVGEVRGEQSSGQAEPAP